MDITCHKPIRVVLVSPPMTCWGLERLVGSAAPSLELLGSSSGMAGVWQELTVTSADVVVVDLEVCPEPLSFDWVQECLPARVILLASSQDTALLDKAVLGGVRGIVCKSEPAPVLLKAIEKVNEGELWIDRGATSRIFMAMARQRAIAQSDPERMRIAALTTREREMIAAVAADTAAPGKVIAGRLCISEHTLRNHLSSIYSKLGLSNRLDLYAYAARHGLYKTGENNDGITAQ
jgi:two-component system nitrate/nitrite response regulator NarL